MFHISFIRALNLFRISSPVLSKAEGLVFRISAAPAAAFMQNKPNFQKPKMNINFYPTMAYENKPPFPANENKPNTNPIQTESNPIPPARYAIRDTKYKPKQTQCRMSSLLKKCMNKRCELLRILQVQRIGQMQS